MDSKNIDTIIQNGIDEINNCDNLNQLEIVKSKYLGKTGSLNVLLKSLGSMPIEQRKEFGSYINEQKITFQNTYNQKKDEIETKELEKKLATESLDITLPGRGEELGSIHPISLIKERIINLFHSIGFITVSGPEIENDFYNFEALNIPKNHPARDMHDTFYLENNDVLRTHTSNTQIRYMLEKNEPPIKIIAPGRVYRVDSDATHSPMFHQLEGLWVDEGITFADLKYIFTDFIHKFFEKDDIKVRFRPSFFPFTEPSAEIDISWGKGWLEVAGCGMVHPNVLKNVNIDSEKYTGWAFGMGIDRYAMLYYQINDLRYFFENDLNFLEQFS